MPRLKSAPAITINDLPPEIISQIVEQVDLITQGDRRAAELLRHLDGGNGNLNDIMAQGPAAFTEMLRGLMGAAIGGGGGGGGRMGGAAGAGAGAGAGGAAAAPGAAGQANQGPPNAQRNPPPPPAAAAPVPPIFGAPAAAQLGFNFNLPPFSPPGAAAAGLPTNGTPSDDEMPALEDISDNETPRPAAATASSSTPSAQPSASTSSANFFAGLLSASTASTAPTSVPVPTPATIIDDDEMPVLEDIEDDSPAPAPAATSATVAMEEDGDDEEDEEDDEDGEDEDEDYDEDYDEDDYSSDDDSFLTYPDGLPVDPLLPLLFATRSFLHAARQRLYRKVHVASAFQASLLLQSLSASSHAARITAEDIEADGDQTQSKNSLPLAVRTLTFDQPSEMSPGRGGATIICNLIKLCTLVEELSVRPAFLKSSTKPFLEALAGLPHLKRVDLRSGLDPIKPFCLTTPRLFSLMRNWRELEDLTVLGLKGAEEGPAREEDDMWDYEFLEEHEDSVEEESEYEDAKDGMEESQGDGEGKAKKREKRARPEKLKAKGLAKLALLDSDAPFTEIALLLKDSRETLKDVVLSRPTDALTRYGLASTVLNFFTNLTYLSLELTATTSHPKAKPLVKIPIPLRPKDYIKGKPDEALLQAIANYPYFLDAVVPYMPHLKTVSWDGNLASTAVFSFFPVSVRTIAWSHSPDIAPAALAKLLKRQVNRTRSVKNADGSVSTKSFKTVVSKGLNCVTVQHDDLHWSDTDLYSLEEATSERGICLHLSGGAGGGGGGGFGFPGAPAGGGGGGQFALPVVAGGGLGLAAPGALGGVGALLGGLPIQVIPGGRPAGGP